MKKDVEYSKYLYPAGLALIALLVFSYIFNPKIDFNGDNCYYYIFASSLANGDGYVDMLGKPTSLFPPGYPLLMLPLRLMTDSVIAQKVLNLLFLFAGTMLLYSVLLREVIKRSLAFLACAGILVTPHLLEFSTMMMSEASCFFFMALAVWAYKNVSFDEGRFYRSWKFYLFLFAVVYAFYIRTQAVVLFGAFFVALIVARRFKVGVALLVAFVVGYLPWMLRSAALNLPQSRYVSQLDFSNVLDNVRMLLVQAVPESVIPFFDVQYNEPPTFILYVVAVLMLGLVLYGFWRLKGLRVMLFLLFAGNIAIVSIMNTPSMYRYMVTLLPFLTLGLFVGLWGLCDTLCGRYLKCSFSPWFLLLLFLPMRFYTGDESKHSLQGLNFQAENPYPVNVTNFLAIGKEVAKRSDAHVVASRKPEILFVHAGVRGKRMTEGTTAAEILNGLLKDNVDYVVQENMGFIYTYKVLLPFISKNRQFFELVAHTKEPLTSFFRFKKAEARKWLLEQGLLDEENR